MKKLLATLLASTMALSAIGGLVACGNDDETPAEVPATGISLSKTTIELSPDGSTGILAKLTPANATTEVVWTSSNPNVASVHGGFVMGLDTGTTTITAKVGDKTATCTVTVGEWDRFMFVGSINSWNPEDDTEQWLFTQDDTDKHLWTYTLNVAPGDMLKIVKAVKDTESGKIVGAGWNGGYNLGINTNNPDGSETNPKKQSIEGASGTLNIHNDGGSGNIVLAEGEEAGNYTFTLKTKSGGGFDSLSYVRNGDPVEA